MEESKIKIILLFVLVVLFTVSSCDSTEPPSTETLTLKLEEVSCTETWITLTTTNLQLPATLTLKQTNPTGDTKSQILNLNTKDSLLYIDSLLPNKNYKHLVSSNEYQVSSNELNVTTMDTTSHDFTWQTWTFGDPGIGSQLYDVAIIDDNNIWAVGRVFLNDSSGQIDTEGYGIVHWDGNIWEIRKVFWTHPQGFKWTLLPFGIHTVTENDIWFVAGDVHHWDGQNLTSYYIGNFPGNPNPILEEGQYLERIWASNDVAYSVGLKGAIAYFDGVDWERIDAQTDGDIFDISASEQSETTVYCPLNFMQNPSLDKILKITQGNKLDFLSYDKGTVYSVWTKRGNPVFACGSKLSENKRGYWEEINFGEGHLLGRIRGNDLNDIYVVGTYGFAGHFNGVGWKQINEVSQSTYQFKSVAVKDNLVVIVGTEYPKGLIIMGRRN